jgi:hypothetical protein|tara:strand:- start:300 stop:617 length:318 start_codon:yes stop_codon:yes gene_type:complete
MKKHTETRLFNMAFAPSSTYFDSGDGSILGMFVEKDHGNLFEYSVNDDPISVCEDFPHKIWVGGLHQQYRYGLVKKTVTYICVDEDEFGLPVVEKWYTKSQREYV